jgi:hypothetical protein
MATLPPADFGRRFGIGTIRDGLSPPQAWRMAQ